MPELTRAATRDRDSRKNGPRTAGKRASGVNGRRFDAGAFIVRTTKTNFQLGSIYALVTAALLATQEPFSALAAKRLPPLSFVCLTQAALLLSVPILIARARSRHDFSALLLTPRNLGKLAVLFLIGIAGLLLYNLGLRNAHPIIVAAILNLSPFWAAIVAKVVSGKAIPISSLVFWPCFSVAFVGAMLIAVSQLNNANGASFSELLDSLVHGSCSWLERSPPAPRAASSIRWP